MPGTGNLKKKNIKYLPASILQCRKMWKGARQVHKVLLSVQSEDTDHAVRGLEGGCIFI